MRPRILMLSLSRDLAESGAHLNEAKVRQRLYAGFCDSVDIVVKSSHPTPGSEIASNLRVHSTATSSNLYAAARMWRISNRLIPQRSCNLIVAQEPFMTGVIGVLLASRWKLPLCLHYVCDFLDNPEWLCERPAHHLLNTIGKAVVRRAAVVRVDAADQVERLAAIGVNSDVVHYVPFLQPGLEAFAAARSDPNLRRDLLGGGTAIVLTVARLDPQKDLDTLLKVATRVTARNPGVRFVVVGDGPERARFEEAVRARGLTPGVRLLGWVDYSRLPAYFASADVFLLTSRYETSARVLVLARAAGLPIVTTAVSGAATLATPETGSAVAAVGAADLLASYVEDRLVRDRHIGAEVAVNQAKVLQSYGEVAIVEGMRRLCATALVPPAKRIRPKLVYILPKFDAATEEHFLHTYGLLDALSQRAEVSVIVERGTGRPAFGRARVFTQQWSRLPPLRFLEMLWLCLRMAVDGHRTFYVHYSYFGAVAAWLITRALSGRVFYWHCVSTFFRKSGWRIDAVSHWLRAELPLALTMRLVDHVVTGTRSLAALYARTFKLDESRLRVVANDVRSARFEVAPAEGIERRRSLGIDSDAFVVLFVHRLAPRKGAHHLPTIARGVLKAVPDAHFVIAGDGPARLELQRAFESDPDLCARVHLLGWVANADVPSWYASADAFVMPSEEEGFPRVLLECMAAGVPFVAADVGGVRDICDPVQYWSIVAAGDHEGFVRRLVALEREPVRRQTLIAAGRARVRLYETDLVAQQTLQQLDLQPVDSVPDSLGSADVSLPRP